jgi:hypothetical protein
MNLEKTSTNTKVKHEWYNKDNTKYKIGVEQIHGKT